MQSNQFWRKNALVILVSVVLLLGLAGWAKAGGEYSISWWTVDGGGGSSSNSTYSISGTVGQPDAGQAASASYTVYSGFWHPANGATTFSGAIYLPVIQ